MEKIKELLHIFCTRKFWFELFVMTMGMVIAGTAVYFFLVPSKLIVGSVTGLSIVICNISDKFFGIHMALSSVIFIINLMLLLIAYVFIGKEFGTKTVYTALILGPILRVLEEYFPYEKYLAEGSTSVMGDPWLDLLAFIIILSASQAILFKINASTGGLDILGKLINKYLHMDIGTSVSIGGAMICCTAFLINPFNLVVLGLIGTWINGLVIDYFSSGLNRKKRVNIITNDYSIVQDFIIKDLKRGCTLHEVVGGYSNEKKIELQVLLTKDEFQRLMEFMSNKDINAFMTADSITEVYGLWATKKTRKLNTDRGKI